MSASSAAAGAAAAAAQAGFATNGVNLENCYTNVFSLTSLAGLHWVRIGFGADAVQRIQKYRKACSNAMSGRRVGDSGAITRNVGCWDDRLGRSKILRDPVLRAYARCLSSNLLSTWRRVQTSVADMLASSSSAEKNASELTACSQSELFVFWTGTDKPSLTHVLIDPEVSNRSSASAVHASGQQPLDDMNNGIDSEVENVALEELEEGGFERQGVTYDMRVLFYRALHTIIERCLVSHSYIRFGNWFVEPVSLSSSPSSTAAAASSSSVQAMVQNSLLQSSFASNASAPALTVTSNVQFSSRGYNNAAGSNGSKQTGGTSRSKNTLPAQSGNTLSSSIISAISPIQQQRSLFYCQAFSFRFFLHGDTAVCCTVDVRRFRSLRQLVYDDVYNAITYAKNSFTAGSNGTETRRSVADKCYHSVILSPFGFKAYLTGNHYSASKPSSAVMSASVAAAVSVPSLAQQERSSIPLQLHVTAQQWLESWKRFYPLRTILSEWSAPNPTTLNRPIHAPNRNNANDNAPAASPSFGGGCSGLQPLSSPYTPVAPTDIASGAASGSVGAVQSVGSASVLTPAGGGVTHSVPSHLIGGPLSATAATRYVTNNSVQDANNNNIKAAAVQHQRSNAGAACAANTCNNFDNQVPFVEVDINGCRMWYPTALVYRVVADDTTSRVGGDSGDNYVGRDADFPTTTARKSVKLPNKWKKQNIHTDALKSRRMQSNDNLLYVLSSTACTNFAHEVCGFGGAPPTLDQLKALVLKKFNSSVVADQLAHKSALLSDSNLALLLSTSHSRLLNDNVRMLTSSTTTNVSKRWFRSINGKEHDSCTRAQKRRRIAPGDVLTRNVVTTSESVSSAFDGSAASNSGGVSFANGGEPSRNATLSSYNLSPSDSAICISPCGVVIGGNNLTDASKIIGKLAHSSCSTAHACECYPSSLLDTASTQTLSPNLLTNISSFLWQSVLTAPQQPLPTNEAYDAASVNTSTSPSKMLCRTRTIPTNAASARRQQTVSDAVLSPPQLQPVFSASTGNVVFQSTTVTSGRVSSASLYESNKNRLQQQRTGGGFQTVKRTHDQTMYGTSPGDDGFDDDTSSIIVNQAPSVGDTHQLQQQQHGNNNNYMYDQPRSTPYDSVLGSAGSYHNPYSAIVDSVKQQHPADDEDLFVADGNGEMTTLSANSCRSLAHVLLRSSEESRSIAVEKTPLIKAASKFHLRLLNPPVFSCSPVTSPSADELHDDETDDGGSESTSRFSVESADKNVISNFMPPYNDSFVQHNGITAPSITHCASPPPQLGSPAVDLRHLSFPHRLPDAAGAQIVSSSSAVRSVKLESIEISEFPTVTASVVHTTEPLNLAPTSPSLFAPRRRHPPVAPLFTSWESWSFAEYAVHQKNDRQSKIDGRAPTGNGATTTHKFVSTEAEVAGTVLSAALVATNKPPKLTSDPWAGMDNSNNATSFMNFDRLSTCRRLPTLSAVRQPAQISPVPPQRSLQHHRKRVSRLTQGHTLANILQTSSSVAAQQQLSLLTTTSVVPNFDSALQARMAFNNSLTPSAMAKSKQLGNMRLEELIVSSPLPGTPTAASSSAAVNSLGNVSRAQSSSLLSAMLVDTPSSSSQASNTFGLTSNTSTSATAPRPAFPTSLVQLLDASPSMTTAAVDRVAVADNISLTGLHTSASSSSFSFHLTANSTPLPSSRTQVNAALPSTAPPLLTPNVGLFESHLNNFLSSTKYVQNGSQVKGEIFTNNDTHMEDVKIERNVSAALQQSLVSDLSLDADSLFGAVPLQHQQKYFDDPISDTVARLPPELGLEMAGGNFALADGENNNYAARKNGGSGELRTEVKNLPKYESRPPVPPANLLRVMVAARRHNSFPQQKPFVSSPTVEVGSAVRPVTADTAVPFDFTDMFTATHDDSTETWGAESALVLTLVLTDSELNHFPDQNLCTTPLCSCNLNVRPQPPSSFHYDNGVASNASYFNGSSGFTSADAGARTDHSSASQQRPLRCNCAFTASLHRRACCNAGLFSEDEFDILGAEDFLRQQQVEMRRSLCTAQLLDRVGSMAASNVGRIASKTSVASMPTRTNIQQAQQSGSPAKPTVGSALLDCSTNLPTQFLLEKTLSKSKSYRSLGRLNEISTNKTAEAVGSGNNSSSVANSFSGRTHIIGLKWEPQESNAATTALQQGAATSVSADSSPASSSLAVTATNGWLCKMLLHMSSNPWMAFSLSASPMHLSPTLSLISEADLFEGKNHGSFTDNAALLRAAGTFRNSMGLFRAAENNNTKTKHSKSNANLDVDTVAFAASAVLLHAANDYDLACATRLHSAAQPAVRSVPLLDMNRVCHIAMAVAGADAFCGSKSITKPAGANRSKTLQRVSQHSLNSFMLATQYLNRLPPIPDIDGDLNAVQDSKRRRQRKNMPSISWLLDINNSNKFGYFHEWLFEGSSPANNDAIEKLRTQKQLEPLLTEAMQMRNESHQWRVVSAEGPLTYRSFLHTAGIDVIEEQCEPVAIPQLLVGYERDSMLSVSPFALRHWEQLHLEPLREQKHVHYLVALPATCGAAGNSRDDILISGVRSFFAQLERTYELCRFGKHMPFQFHHLNIDNNNNGATSDAGIFKIDIKLASDDLLAVHSSTAAASSWSSWFQQNLCGGVETRLTRLLKVYCYALKQQITARLFNEYNFVLARSTPVAAGTHMPTTSAVVAPAANARVGGVSSLSNAGYSTLPDVTTRQFQPQSRTSSMKLLLASARITSVNVTSGSVAASQQSAQFNSTDNLSAVAQYQQQQKQQQQQPITTKIIGAAAVAHEAGLVANNSGHVNKFNSNFSMSNNNSVIRSNTLSASQHSYYDDDSLSAVGHAPPHSPTHHGGDKLASSLYTPDRSWIRYCGAHDDQRLAGVQAVVIYIIDPFSCDLACGSSSMYSSAQRMTALAYLRVLYEIRQELPAAIRDLVQFQLVPIQYVRTEFSSLPSVVSNFTDGSAFMPGTASVQHIFNVRELDVMRSLSLSIYAQLWRRVCSVPVSAQRPKVLTGRGPAALHRERLLQRCIGGLSSVSNANNNNDDALNNVEAASSAVGGIAARLYSSPYALQLQQDPDTLLKETFGERQEKSNVLMIAYLLTDDQRWLIATVSDELGELVDANVIALWPFSVSERYITPSLPPTSDISTSQADKAISPTTAADTLTTTAPPSQSSSQGVTCSSPPPRSIIHYALTKLWDYLVDTLINTSTTQPWRLVVTRIGRIGHNELKLWSTMLSKKALGRFASHLRNMCPSCARSQHCHAMPSVLSACLISLEPESSLEVYTSAFFHDDRVMAATASRSPLSTPEDASCTHILAYAVAAHAQPPISQAKTTLFSMSSSATSLSNNNTAQYGRNGQSISSAHGYADLSTGGGAGALFSGTGGSRDLLSSTDDMMGVGGDAADPFGLGMDVAGMADGLVQADDLNFGDEDLDHLFDAIDTANFNIASPPLSPKASSTAAGTAHLSSMQHHQQQHNVVSGGGSSAPGYSGSMSSRPATPSNRQFYSSSRSQQYHHSIYQHQQHGQLPGQGTNNNDTAGHPSSYASSNHLVFQPHTGFSFTDNNVKPQHHFGGNGQQQQTMLPPPSSIPSLSYPTLEDVTSGAQLSQQPLAIGLYISTAKLPRMPHWFWSNAPSRSELSCPVVLKASLHIHTPNVHNQLNGEQCQSQVRSNHPLDAAATQRAVRHVLELFNASSWLILEPSALAAAPALSDRRSCLPIHIQTLLQLYHNFNTLCNFQENNKGSQ